MRLWTVHPKYLDRQGLLAVWREGLLAQAVLKGQTRGYRNHPQLDRFRAHPEPLAAIGAYLSEVQAEASGRGYHFDRSKIEPVRKVGRIPATRGQLAFESGHLLQKLLARSPIWYDELSGLKSLEPHPLFDIVEGGVEDWEKGCSEPDETNSDTVP